jgi:hypothetical protein
MEDKQVLVLGKLTVIGTQSLLQFITNNLDGIAEMPPRGSAKVRYKGARRIYFPEEIIAKYHYDILTETAVPPREVHFAYDPDNPQIVGKVGKEWAFKMEAGTYLSREMKRLLGPVMLAIGVPIGYVASSLGTPQAKLFYPTPPVTTASFMLQEAVLYANGVNLADSWTPVADSQLRKLIRPILQEFKLYLNQHSNIICSEQTLQPIHISSNWATRRIGPCIASGLSRHLDYLERNLHHTDSPAADEPMSIIEPTRFAGTVGQCLALARSLGYINQICPEKDVVQFVYNVTSKRIHVVIQGEITMNLSFKRRRHEPYLSKILMVVLPQLGVPRSEQIAMTGSANKTPFISGNGRVRITFRRGELCAYSGKHQIFRQKNPRDMSTQMKTILNRILPALGYEQVAGSIRKLV